jgi:hypothetical protein
LVPGIVILLIPIVQELSLDTNRGARITTALFVVLGALSVAIHFRGATSYAAVDGWNLGPPDINAAPDIVWRWNNPQFLSGLGDLYRPAPASAATPQPVPPQPLRSYRQLLTSSINRLNLHPAQEFTLPVRIENPSDETWDSRGPHPITISYKWFENGRMLPIEGLRTALPSSVGPKQSVLSDVRVAAPAQAGRFSLRVTLVEEGVTWFMTKTNMFLELTATVQ